MATAMSDFFEAIENEIDAAMYNKEEDPERFVTHDDLGRIWTTNRLQELCRLADLDHTSDEEYLRENFLRTISILVGTKWRHWTRFHKIFFDRRYTQRMDKDIDRYTWEELRSDHFLGNDKDAGDFLRVRDAFDPVVIVEGMVKVYEKRRRLPLIRPKNGVEPELGRGGYGKVTQAVIAPSQYHRKTMPQPKSYPVARKVLIKKEDFRKEVGNLSKLRRAPLKHDHIAPFLAVISIGEEFNILSELAAMDLQAFLEGGHTQFKVNPENLMAAMTGLASALKFLHGGMDLPRNTHSPADAANEEGPVVCFHMDLKPENVLIYPEVGYDVGIWKFNDFGISRIKGPSRKQRGGVTQRSPNNLQIPTILGDLKKSLSSRPDEPSRTNAKRHSGTWTAPEVHQSDEKVVGTESDIWSFMCIFVLVCALALGSEELEHVEATRGKTRDGKHDNAVNGDCFYWKLAEGLVLNPHVEAWVELLPHRQITHIRNNYLLPNCRSLILSGLAIEPQDRINAFELQQRLHEISNHQPKVHLKRIDASKPLPPDPKSPVLVPFGYAENDLSPQLSVNVELANDGADPSDLAAQLQILPHPHAIARDPPMLHVETTQRNNLALQNKMPNGILDYKGKGRAISPLPIPETNKSALTFDAETLDHEEDLYNDESSSHSNREFGSPGPSKRLLPTQSTGNFKAGLKRPGRAGTFPAVPTDPTPLKSHEKPQFSGRTPALQRVASQILPSFGGTSVLPKTPTRISSQASPLGIVDRDDVTKPGLSPRRVQTDPVRPLDRPTLQKGSISTPAVISNAVTPNGVLPDSKATVSRQRKSTSRPNSNRSSRSILPSIISETSGIPSANGVLEPITIFDLDLKNITRTIIPSSCNIVAFLSPENIYIYPIRGEEHACHALEPPQGCKWVSASIAGRWILGRAYSISKRHTVFKIFRVYDVKYGVVHIERYDQSPESLFEEGVISEDGHLLYQEQSSIRLGNMESGDLELLPTQGMVKKSWFNANGTWAFAWSTKSRTHHVKAWKVSNTAIYREFTYNIRDHESQDTPIRDVISFPEDLRLVLWKSHDDLVVSPDLRKTVSGGAEDPQQFKGLQALAICPRQDAVVYVRTKTKWSGFRLRPRTRLYIRKMMFDGEGNVNFGSVQKVELRYPFVPGSSISIFYEASGVQCFVAHRKGHVEKVVFEERAF